MDEPRLLTRAEAAAYCKLSTRGFDDALRWGAIHPPIPGVREKRWDRRHFEYDAANHFGIVYFIGFGPYVKIGFTAQLLPKRVAAIQTGCPERLTVHAFERAKASRETDLHNRFGELRLNGEWFRHEGELADYIKTLRGAGG